MRRLFPLLLLALLAAPELALASVSKMGSGSSVTCDTTPAAGSNLDDTSVSNEYIRDIVCVNASSTTVYVGGSSVTTTSTPIAAGGTYKAQLGANVVPQCYAAASTTITCVEMLGASEADVSPAGGGSRVELLASGTDTTVNATSTLLFSTVTGSGANVIAALPSWCHTIQFEYRLDSQTGGAAAGLALSFGGLNPSGQILWSGTWSSTTATSAAAAANHQMLIGRNVPGIAYGATNAGTTGNLLYGAFLPRNFQISRVFSSAPTTTLSAPWRLYCLGG